MGKAPNLSYSRGEAAKDVAEKLGLRKDDFVETKTFEAGYRGSWFRCQIKGIETSYRNHVRYKLQFVEFPDESLHWCQAYQQRHRGQEDSFELMVRPAPPPASYPPNSLQSLSGRTAIAPKPWEVGDFVDWSNKDAWWEASIAGFTPQGNLKVSLFEPPQGEGGTFEVEDKDLRPTLSWTGAEKWTIAVSTINGRAAGEVLEFPCSTVTEKSDVDFEESPIEVEATGANESELKIFPSLGKLRDAIRNLHGTAGPSQGAKPSESNFCGEFVEAGGEDVGEKAMNAPLVPKEEIMGTQQVPRTVLNAPFIPGDATATPLVPEKDNLTIHSLSEKGDVATSRTSEGDLIITKSLQGDGTAVNGSIHGYAVVTPSMPENLMKSTNTADNEESSTDSEYIEDLLYIKRLISQRRIRKYMRYRRQVKKYISISRQSKSRALRKV